VKVKREALRVDRARLLADIDQLAGFGADPAGGITRRSYSQAFEEASHWLLERMQAAGLAARIDAVGNVVGRMGPPGPVVLSGSHIDTVPGGGHLDGALGVLAALECARVFAEQGVRLRRGYETVAFVDEEGAYLSLFGSRALTGTVSESEVAAARDAGERSLTDALRGVGLDPAALDQVCRAPRDLHAFVELHIEQGPVLESSDVPIGVVEGVVGILQSGFVFSGRADHAGTTPPAMRRDALRAATTFIDSAWREFDRLAGAQSRMNFGMLDIERPAANVVPRSVRVHQELRDLELTRLEELRDVTRQCARDAALKHSVDVRMRTLSLDLPARMSESVMGVIEDAADGLGLPCLRMVSGAGHDAQVLAGACPSGMIFVPSRDGASHRAEEWTDPDHLVEGANVLLHTLVELLTRVD